MLIRTLTRFFPFQHLSLEALKTVARHTQLVSIPGERWVLRPPRRLSGSYYLLDGRVLVDDKIITSLDPRARLAIIPGSVAVKTLNTVQLLRVDTQPIAFLLEPTSGSQAVVETASGDGWLERFLGSRIMQQLNPTGWQQVLASLESFEVEAGEVVIRQGDVGAHFYVIRRGQFEVFDKVKSLAVLSFGDFCGEDALISGGPRNASVRALTPGALMALHKCAFQKLLLDCVVRFVGGDGSSILALDESEPDADAHIALPYLREGCRMLDRKKSWLVAADVPEQAALGCFILTHQGFDAAVMVTKPEPCDLLPTGVVG